jgi:hypothetical protein
MPELGSIDVIVPDTTLIDPDKITVNAICASVFSSLAREFNPVGFSENMLVRALSRCGAQMICDEQMFDALESTVKQVLAAVNPVAKPGDRDDPQVLQARLCLNERLDDLSRRSQRHANDFFRGMRQLGELRRDRSNGVFTLNHPDERFTNESQCLTYLLLRFRTGQQFCRDCGEAGRGSWIAARRCWQCANCRTQTCVRNGTVFARSPLPLVQWFHAIGIALYFPNAAACDVAMAIGVRRLPTVRSMLKKIRGAMMSDVATNMLAGLDQVYLPGA